MLTQVLRMHLHPYRIGHRDRAIGRDLVLDMDGTDGREGKSNPVSNSIANGKVNANG